MNGIMALRFGPEEVTGDLGKSSFSGVERTEDRMKYRVLLYTAVIGIRGIHSSPKPFNGTWWAKSLTGRNRFSPSRNFVCLHCSEISPREHKLKHACFFFFFLVKKKGILHLFYTLLCEIPTSCNEQSFSPKIYEWNTFCFSVLSK